MRSDSKVEITNKGNVGNQNITIYAIQQRKTLLGKIIKAFCNLDDVNPEYSDTTDFDTYNIDEKIKFNNLQVYNSIIKEYKANAFLIGKLLDVKDNIKETSKNRILGLVSLEYKNTIVMLKYDTKDFIVAQNGDYIFSLLLTKFKDKLDKDPDLKDISDEQIFEGLTSFLVYCFIECKILEKPQW